MKRKLILVLLLATAFFILVAMAKTDRQKQQAQQNLKNADVVLVKTSSPVAVAENFHVTAGATIAVIVPRQGMNMAANFNRGIEAEVGQSQPGKMVAHTFAFATRTAISLLNA